MEKADKMDAFWSKLSVEERAALHTAYGVLRKMEKWKEQDFRRPGEILQNAESVRGSIVNVRGDFARFVEDHIEQCPDGESMMRAILEMK